VVTPAQRRRAVEHLKSEGLGSERRVCRLMALSRSVARYRRLGRHDTVLRERLKALAQEYPRYGCPTLHDLLKTEGQVINIKRTYRLYREERLQVRRKRRRKLHVPRVPMLVPSSANERWSVDFVSDQLATGRRFRVFNVVDDFTRECVLQVVDFSISGEASVPRARSLVQHPDIAADDRLRQRPRADLKSDVPLVATGGCEAALHPAWKAHAKLIR
jgi:putative transposase